VATDAQLALAIIAKDKATADLKKVERQLDRLEKKHKSFAGSAAKAFATGAVVAFGVASVKAFADAEKSQARLELAYKKFPALAGTSIDSLRALNQEMQAKVGVDDDALASAQATLAQFQLTGEEIKRLTPLLVDYATVTGQDVTAAASSLGKAFMGNAKALKTIGINFKATGDTAADFETVMAALEEKVGGAGDAFGNTTAGQLARLDAQFGDLQETAGEALVPALQGLVSVATPLAKAAGAIPAPVRSAAIAATALGVAALVAGPRILSMRASLIAANAAAGKAPAAMGKYAGSLKAVGVGAATAAVALPVIGSVVDKIGDSMFGTTTQAVDLKDSLSKIAATGKVEGLGQFGDGLKDIGAEIEHLANPGLSQRVEDVFGTLAGNGGGEGRNRVLEQVQQIDAALTDMVSSGNASGAAKALAALEQSAQDAGAPAGALTELLTGYSTAAKEAARTSDEAADSVGGLGSNAAALKVEITGVTAALKGWDAIDDRGAAADALAGSIDSLSEAVKKNKGTLAGNTDAARTARAAFRESADAVKNYAETFKDPERKAAVLRDGLDKLKGRLKKMGLSGSEIAEITKPYDAAANAAQRVIDTQAGIQRKIVVDIVTNYGPGSSVYDSQVPDAAKPRKKKKKAAGGGAIFGPGTATSDSIPALLSHGEYVINARSASALGYDTLDALNRYAKGGKVKAKPKAPKVKPKPRITRAGMARARIADLMGQRRDAAGSIMSSLLGSVGIGAAFDPSGYGDALDNLADAKSDVVSAQESLNEAKAARANAKSRADLAAAIEAEAKAQRDLNAAKQGQAVAEKAVERAKPNAKNFKAGLKGLAERMHKFRSVLKALAKRGLRADLLSQLVDMGPMEGLDEARALLTATPKDMSEINATQAQLVADARAIGNFGAHAEFDPLIAAQRNIIRGGAGDPVYVSKTVLMLDNRVVAEGLQHYKKRNGGAPLGLS
jgi:hypothetical protein